MDMAYDDNWTMVAAFRRWDYAGDLPRERFLGISDRGLRMPSYLCAVYVVDALAPRKRKA